MHTLTPDKKTCLTLALLWPHPVGYTTVQSDLCCTAITQQTIACETTGASLSIYYHVAPGTWHMATARNTKPKTKQRQNLQRIYCCVIEWLGYVQGQRKASRHTFATFALASIYPRTARIYKTEASSFVRTNIYSKQVQDMLTQKQT